jgi:hypothetical protein
MNAQSLVKSLQEELASYESDIIVTANLSAPSAIRLIAILQVASRHPEMPQAEFDFIKMMVEKIAQGFKPEHTAIAEVIRRGWDQEHDRDFAV